MAEQIELTRSWLCWYTFGPVAAVVPGEEAEEGPRNSTVCAIATDQP